MTEHFRSNNAKNNISRRQVMIGAAGMSFAIALGSHADAATVASQALGKTINPWVSIAPDGTITIMSAATEMGQGSMTSLPLVLAEELDADWSKVRVVPAPVIDQIYGNSAYFNMIYTAGSNAVRSYFMKLRIFGAQARRVLLDNAAKKLGVPVEELTTEPSVVVHAKSGRRLSYGEIAAFAEIPAQAPVITKEQLKKPSDFRLIGKDVMRVELPTKVNGSAQYSIDVQLPGMVYGAVVRAPVEGSGPEKFDEAKVHAVAGVIKTVKLPYGIGVVAETPWAAFEARQIIADSASWSKSGKAWGFDSETGQAAFAAVARDLSRQGTDWFKTGDLRGELCQGRRHDGCLVSLRLRLSRADGTVECRRVGVAIGRLCRGLDGYAEPNHGVGSDREGARHLARQGHRQLHADGRRVWPARPARFRLHRRCGAAGERGGPAGEGDLDARG